MTLYCCSSVGGSDTLSRRGYAINVLAFAFLKGSASCSDICLRALHTSINRSAASRMGGG